MVHWSQEGDSTNLTYIRKMSLALKWHFLVSSIIRDLSTKYTAFQKVNRYGYTSSSSIKRSSKLPLKMYEYYLTSNEWMWHTFMVDEKGDRYK